MTTGARAMTECLIREGVPLVFGYPGAAIAPFYDSLSCSGIRHILTRTEQGAGHAASGYARISGKPGVCIATSGPGATNLFTAIATAYSDSIPLVAITGQVDSHLLGRDVFQEVDTTGAVEPFTKYAYLVRDAASLPQVFREAFHIAGTGRKGPVLIDVPVDVQAAEVDFRYPEEVSIRGYKPRYEGHPVQARRVAEAIAAAKRPLLCCGGGVLLSGAEHEVRRLCEASGIPVVWTMMALGVLPYGHPCRIGMVGRNGSPAANRAVQESDLLVLVGARAGDRALTRPDAAGLRAAVVHIDIDTAEIGKNMDAAIPLVGDARRVLEQLGEIGIGGPWKPWAEDLVRLREREEAADGTVGKTEFVEPNAFVRLLCEKLPEDAVYVSDVGQNQVWTARNYRGRGRFLTTGGMGTMGYAIPAALGAKLAAPERTVVAVCGDGAFQMSMNELAAIRQHDAPVKIIVMNNRRLGLVREIQRSSPGGNEFAVDLAGSPDFGGIAGAYGIAHERIHSGADAGAALDRMLADDQPYLLECMIDPEEGTV